jgi:hypothetical protein
VITGCAGCHHIVPEVLSSQVTRINVINGQVAALFPAILAGEIVASEDLAPVELHAQTRPIHHMLKADDRRTGDNLIDCMDITASVDNQRGFISYYQPDGSPYCTNVDRLKICIQNQYVIEH